MWGPRGSAWLGLAADDGAEEPASSTREGWAAVGERMLADWDKVGWGLFFLGGLKRWG